MTRRFFTCFTISLIAWTTFCIPRRKAVSSIQLSSGWRFQSGDDLRWADPSWDDSAWRPIPSNGIWNTGNLESFDRFVWFRIRFSLPESFRQNAMTPWMADTLQIVLGIMGGELQAFLNGALIGENERSLDPLVDFSPSSIPPDTAGHARLCRYLLSASDPRLRWDEENVLAVRIPGSGGLDPRISQVRMVTWKDALWIDTNRPFRMRGGRSYEKEVVLTNRSSRYALQGYFTLRVAQIKPRRILYNVSYAVDLPPGTSQIFTFHCEHPGHPCRAVYFFIDRKTRESVSVKEAFHAF